MKHTFCFHTFALIWIVMNSGCGIPSAGTDNTVLSVVINGCANADYVRAGEAKYGEEKEPEITVVDNTIHYSRSTDHMCCRTVDMTKNIFAGHIDLFEKWSGEGCRCMCFSEINASLENIPSGIYIVTVYEIDGEISRRENTDQVILISKEISIQ